MPANMPIPCVCGAIGDESSEAVHRPPLSSRSENKHLTQARDGSETASHILVLVYVLLLIEVKCVSYRGTWREERLAQSSGSIHLQQPPRVLTMIFEIIVRLNTHGISTLSFNEFKRFSDWNGVHHSNLAHDLNPPDSWPPSFFWVPKSWNSQLPAFLFGISRPTLLRSTPPSAEDVALYE